MAVSKDQLQETLDISANVIFQQAEIYIDRVLTVKYNGNGTCVVIPLNDLSEAIHSGIPSHVVTSLVRLYEAKNWTVKVDSDKLAGFWLEFS